MIYFSQSASVQWVRCWADWSVIWCVLRAYYGHRTSVDFSVMGSSSGVWPWSMIFKNGFIISTWKCVINIITMLCYYVVRFNLIFVYLKLVLMKRDTFTFYIYLFVNMFEKCNLLGTFIFFFTICSLYFVPLLGSDPCVLADFYTTILNGQKTFSATPPKWQIPVKQF